MFSEVITDMRLLQRNLLACLRNFYIRCYRKAIREAQKGSSALLHNFDGHALNYSPAVCQSSLQLIESAYMYRQRSRTLWLHFPFPEEAEMLVAL
jgi:hypothetical protein